jgi:subfamily B ATP-binding cassette protein MsbA
MRENKLLLARFVASGIGRTLATIASIILIQQFLAATFGRTEGWLGTIAMRIGPTGMLSAVAGLLFSAYVLSAVLYYDNQVTQQRIVRRLELGIMERVIRHLLTLSIPYFDRQSSGDILHAVRGDVVELRRVVIAVTNVFAEGAMVIALLAGATVVSPLLALWALVLLPLALLPVGVAARRLLIDATKMRSEGFGVMDAILQIIGGSRIIKSYRNEEREAERAVSRARRFFDRSLRISRTMALARITLESLAGLGLIGVIVVGGFQVMRGALAWPDLLAFIVAVRALNGPINNLNTNYLEIQTAQVASKRIADLLDERSEIVERPDALPLVAAPRHIRFENVGFSYGERTVLRNISLEVRAGETLGIIGPSGAGKSTLLGLVARFYDPSSGRICFDDTDLRDLRLADLYDSIALVTQDPFLFTDTVRENIRYGHIAATDAEIEAGARAALIHDEIMLLPEGYDTVVGGPERRLSRGQQQRINIARAFVKNAPILLLDEATASIDAIAEQEVQAAVERLFEGRTTFIVAHRLSALRAADRIIVIDQGTIVASGTPDELLRESDVYRQIWEAQQIGG